jgi:hypothetical protein
MLANTQCPDQNFSETFSLKLSSSDEDLIICSVAFIVISSEATRKKHK